MTSASIADDALSSKRENLSTHEKQQIAPQDIAVIGSGITGLSAAWALSHHHHVTLYEKEPRAGGHSNTVDIVSNGQKIAVDTGFIVYNEANYPNLVALFEHLKVETAASDMSFGASLREGACEYSGQTLSSVFATRKNLVSPRFWRMLVDVVRFHRCAKKTLQHDIPDHVTLDDFVKTHRLSDIFVHDFIGPMAGAIWSTPTDEMLAYPAASFLKFYQNHGLLQVINMPLWRTVNKGSRQYVEKILAQFKGELKLNTPVMLVKRDERKIIITDKTGVTKNFDQVVFACHANTALALLQNPSPKQESLLKSFRYQPNHCVLHTDKTAMPKQKRAWSAWNVVERNGKTSVTYWMNKLQPLECQEDIFVTLNPLNDLENVLAQFDYEHPLFDKAAYQAQKEIWKYQGSTYLKGSEFDQADGSRKNNKEQDNDPGVWFCGAHLGAGFHEDGLQAGLAVAEAIGGFRRPWRIENESSRIYLNADE